MYPHLSCRHLTKLDAAVARGQFDAPKVFDPLLQVLWKRGAAHERDYIGTCAVDVAKDWPSASKTLYPPGMRLTVQGGGKGRPYAASAAIL